MDVASTHGPPLLLTRNKHFIVGGHRLILLCILLISPFILSVIITAFPENELVPKQPTYYALKGESTQLNCGIQSGRLLQQYRATWDKSGKIIYDQISPPPQGFNRYSLNPSNLSLIINEVQLTDTSNQYHCLLTVRDPQSQNTYKYKRLLKHNISLVVLSKYIAMGSAFT